MKCGAARAEAGLFAAYATDVGKVRTLQEDAHIEDAKGGIFLVSDGMGGHGAGGLASDIVARVLPALILKRVADGASPEAASVALRESIRDLSFRLQAEAKGKAGLAGTGATVVLLLIRGGRASIAHLGDSRACLFRSGKLEWLTRDHTIAQLLEEQGTITHEETRTHSARSRLSRYVGMEGEALADVKSIDLRPRDRLLLCTDGLSGVVEDRVVSRILDEQPDTTRACAQLVDAANAVGNDNVTVVLVDWRPSP